REYKLPSFFSALFVSLEVVMEVLIPFEMADMLDYGINAGNMEFVIQSGIRLVIYACLTILFGNLAGRAASTAACGFGKNLRQDMYYNIQNFSFSNIDKFSTSSLITRMTTDVQNVQQAYLMLIRIAFRSPIMMIFSSVFAFRIYPKLAAVFVICLPILLAGLLFIIKITHPIFVRVFKTYDKLNRTVQENLRGIRVVKSFIREDHEAEKFDETSDSIRRDFTRAEKNIAWNAPLMQSCSYICMILVSWLGANAIIASGNNPELGLTTGMLMSLITYSMQILMSVMMISVVFVMVIISRESAERIYEVLKEESDLKNNEHPVFEVPDGSIRFEHVTFRYSKKADKNVLNDICIDIKSGETVGIIGGTGSSKSTLVQMIPRLYDTTEGSVLVGGIDVKDYDIKTLRDSVAMVLQKNVLFSGTVRENLLWGNEHATQEEIEHACDLAQASPFINEMPDKYETYIEQGGSNVSGGQKQRLCIARALLKKPKVLILDDSTSAVDTKTDALIRKAFAEEIPDTTKIISAQRIASVMEADKIIILDAGEIVAMGTHEELMATSDIYRETYESQMEG
ncbi:MAG: ABC transporter ATP-binding protein, partial [Oscillospiraceae bacterium]|nr:ABC transporter ATP-binding protein [Oscillospiraceae bacterium]